MSDNQQKGPSTYSAEQVTQGEIILRQPWQRIVFMTGLAAAVLLPLALGIYYFR
ncbi:MAG: hypothetical protein JSS54_14950 [Proteobacteria bacterium]|nr:hypothetical protein [Pseudomonadota bacterium]MBS0270257.1 hypothetical protein [Pseudomonadota bacterium]